MTGKIEEQRLRLAAGFAAQRLVDAGANAMGRFGSRDDALGAGEHHPGFEGGGLRHGDGLDQLLVVELRDQRRIAVIAQTAGMNARRHEVVAQRVHLHQRREAGGIAVVVGIDALGQRRAGGRLDGNKADLLRALVARCRIAEEGEADAGEIAAAAAGGEDHVRVLAEFLELLLGFLADDGLVQQHMVEHRAQGVFGAGRRYRGFHRLGNGDAEAALVVRIGRQDVAAGLGLVGRAGNHFATEGLHHQAAIGLLVVADLDHENFDRQAEHLAGKGERRSPLSGAGFRHQALGAGDLVEIGLRYG